MEIADERLYCGRIVSGNWVCGVFSSCSESIAYFFFQAEDGIRDVAVTGVQTCALPISALNRVVQRPSLRRVLPAKGSSERGRTRLAVGMARARPRPLRHSSCRRQQSWLDRKSTRLNSSHGYISYAVFCLKKKKTILAALMSELHIPSPFHGSDLWPLFSTAPLSAVPPPSAPCLPSIFHRHVRCLSPQHHA